MWCPSVSLSVWTNAWLAGQAAPDDVLDALSAWAPQHSVTAYDAVAAGKTGLPWPDMDRAGAMSLLQTVRTAAGPRPPAGQWPDGPAISLLLPVPGDVRGLSAGTQFARDALAAAEAVVVSGADGEAIGVVPEVLWEDSDGSEDQPGACTLVWSVYSLPAGPVADPMDLGEAEYALRSAVRSAADALGRLDLSVAGEHDPRALVEEIIEAGGHHRVPDHAPTRAVRVLATAAQVDAIVMVTSGLSPIGIHSASEARIADEAIRPLSAVVRSARSAAVSAILASAWRR